MRYIEGLTSDSSSMCDWSRELSTTTRDMVSSDPDTLAVAIPGWLDDLIAQDKTASSADAIDTLFALRDFMLQEALNVVKFA